MIFIPLMTSTTLKAIMIVTVTATVRTFVKARNVRSDAGLLLFPELTDLVSAIVTIPIEWIIADAT